MAETPIIIVLPSNCFINVKTWTRGFDHCPSKETREIQSLAWVSAVTKVTKIFFTLLGLYCRCFLLSPFSLSQLSFLVDFSLSFFFRLRHSEFAQQERRYKHHRVCRWTLHLLHTEHFCSCEIFWSSRKFWSLHFSGQHCQQCNDTHTNDFFLLCLGTWHRSFFACNAFWMCSNFGLLLHLCHCQSLKS